MASIVLKDRVKVIATTTGTGAITLGAAATGYQNFSAIGDGNSTYYTIALQSGNEWEVGTGTVTEVAGTFTLSRDTVFESSNAGNLVNFSAGTKDVFATYPAERAVYLDAAGSAVTTLDIGTLGASTANIGTANITAGTISTTPASGNDLVNKTYVDTLAASGIHFHQPVRVESPINLTATYNNGTAGVGATLTNSGTQAALVIDGVAVNVADRVLIYEQTTQTQNGIYVVTNVGSGSTNWVLTRASDADTYVINSANGLSEGSTVFVQQGSTGAGETYTCNTSGTITFGTTNITFAQISSAQIYSAGTGLTLSGTQFSITNAGTAGTYGSASQVPVFVTNAQGQVTSVTNTAIGITSAAVSGLAASATTDTTNAANITSGTLPVARLNGSYTGITGVGILAAGTWNGSVIAAAYGGTGQSSYAVGDLLYADTSTSLAKLADVATGNSLISGGVGTAPAWGKIGLTTHVSGTLPIANGGTGATDAATARSNLGAGTGNGSVTSVEAGTYLTGGTITTSGTLAVDATSANTASKVVARDASGNFSANTITATLSGNATNVTGTVAVANGGTGATDAAGARTSLGATTVGSNLFTLPNPGAITFPRFNVDNTVSSLDAAAFRTAIGAGAGTVTSVAVSGGTTGLTTSGGPITTSGTITLSGTLAVANGGTGATDAGGARTNLGATTLGGNLFTLSNVAAISFPRFNADNTVSSLDAAAFRTAIGAGTSSATGTVTSVGGTGTVSGLSLSGTVTTSGNLTLGGTLAVTPSNFASQTANTVLAAPNGSAGTPTFRAIVAADIPTLNQNTTGSAGSVSTSVTFNNSGSGAASGTTFNGGTAQTISYNTIGAQPAGTYVTSVAATAPVASTGGTTPTISMAAASSSTNGYLTSADWSTFNSKGSGNGTVTSVATSGTVSGLTLTGGTITTTGTITLGGTLSVTPSNFASQTANTFLAAPNGSAGTPTFRGIVAADVPTLNQNTTGNAATATVLSGSTAKKSIYALSNTGGSGQYIFLGTWSAANQSGSKVTININIGAGYNASVSQNNLYTVQFKTSNGSSSQAGSAGNFLADGLVYRQGAGSAIANLRVVQISASSYAFYANCGSFSGDNSFYEVSVAQGTWTNSNTFVTPSGNFIDLPIYTLLDSTNYNSYAPTLTGTGASGTWGISITGNAATATSLSGTVAVANGGTGQTTYTNGQLLIGNTTGNTLAKATLTAGTGMSITNGAGAITITNSAPDQTVSLTGAGATSISGTYPSFTITSTNTTYAAATSTVAGLIELASDTQQTVAANAVTTTASRTYGLQVNSSGQGVVNVPWTDTVYSLPAATSTIRGGIELGSDTVQTVAANAVTTTASRSYALQVNADGQGVVNVPWTSGGGDVTLTGVQTLTNKTISSGVYSNVVDVTGSVRSTAITVAASTIDCAVGNYFTKVINGATTFIFSSAPSSRAYSFVFELTQVSGAVTWPASVRWPSATAPTLTAGKTHLFVFITDNAGSTWLGAANVDYTS